MSVPYARPSLEYGYNARVDSRDYDSRRRTYRPTRARGGPPAQKQAVRCYFSYIHVFFLYRMPSKFTCTEEGAT